MISLFVSLDELKLNIHHIKFNIWQYSNCNVICVNKQMHEKLTSNVKLYAMPEIFNRRQNQIPQSLFNFLQFKVKLKVEILFSFLIFLISLLNTRTNVFKESFYDLKIISIHYWYILHLINIERKKNNIQFWKYLILFISCKKH